MKILIVSQRFYPENFRINDIALTLKNDGNEIWVLTGLPNYPKGKYYDGYNSRSKGENWEGIHIVRSFERPRGKGPINRLLNYNSFAASGKKKVKELPPDFDIVFVNELSPIMGAEPAIEYKKLHGTPLLMYEMDLWPDSLEAGGIHPSSPIYKYYETVSRKIYSSMDLILASSKPHIKRINELTSGKVKCEYLPQYAEEIFVRNPEPISKSDGKTIFLFAGNVGKAQSIATIYNAAKIIRERDDIEIWIAGNGSDMPKLKKMMKDDSLRNIKILGAIPLSEMPSYYDKATAFLITLSNSRFCSMTLPGKLQSYMAYGKPIIASAGEAVEDAIRESGAGLFSESCNFKGLAANMVSLSEMPSETIYGISCKSFHFYSENYSKNLFFISLEEKIKGIKDSKCN